MKFDCETSNKTFYSNVSCTYKTYKGGKCLANFRATIMRRSLNFKSTTLLQRQNSDGYQTILEFKNIEICKLLKNLEAAPVPFIGKFLEFLKSGSAFGSGNVMSMCDLTSGEMNFFNASLENFPAISLFPSGDYSLSVHFFDNVDDKIIKMSFLVHFSRS